MTESEWLACDDVGRMARFLLGRASERKFRLLFCACCRRVWYLLDDPRGRNRLEDTERYWDELAVRIARPAAGEATGVPGPRGSDAAAAWAVALLVLPSLSPDNVEDLFWFAADAERLPAAPGYGSGAGIIRDLFGPLLFRSVPIDEAWLLWNDGCVVKLATVIYEERAFGLLPILADALEEAGCDNEDVLTHCRSGSEHVRGCWVVDLLLGQE